MRDIFNLKDLKLVFSLLLEHNSLFLIPNINGIVVNSTSDILKD